MTKNTVSAFLLHENSENDISRPAFETNFHFLHKLLILKLLNGKSEVQKSVIFENQIPLNVNINFPQMFSQQVAFLINHIVFLCILASGGVLFDK